MNTHIRILRVNYNHSSVRTYIHMHVTIHTYIHTYILYIHAYIHPYYVDRVVNLICYRGYTLGEPNLLVSLILQVSLFECPRISNRSC
jgi:hypothetical protein